jgi:hypothetical protein
VVSAAAVVPTVAAVAAVTAIVGLVAMVPAALVLVATVAAEEVADRSDDVIDRAGRSAVRGSVPAHLVRLAVGAATLAAVTRLFPIRAVVRPTEGVSQ